MNLFQLEAGAITVKVSSRIRQRAVDSLRMGLVLCALLPFECSPGEPNADVACKDAGTGSYAALNECSAALYRQADARLNEHFSIALNSAKKHPEAEYVTRGLNVAQRAWIDYRDRTCELASWIESYADAPARRATCLRELTNRRTKDVDELRMCIEAKGFAGRCPLSQ